MLVTVGRIGRAHGVRGEIAVEVRTDVPEERFAVGAVLHVADSRSATVTSAPSRRGERGGAVSRTAPAALTVSRTRWHKGGLLIQFDEVPDRNTAEELRGSLLQVEVEDEERPSDPDEYFDHQLVGLRMVTADDVEVGTVADVVHGPNQDVLIVRRPEGGDVMVPFVAQIVPEVDLEAGRVVVEPPPGLLELDQPGDSASAANRERSDRAGE